MGERYLDMLEVSQKQAYIFGSNRLRDNIHNSDVIAYITSPEYFKTLPAWNSVFDEDKNYVYSGGGHTILEFPDKDSAVKFNKAYTRKVREDFPDIELFVTVNQYDDKIPPYENLDNLTKKLEKKKSVREASFHQESFGIEATDSNTRKPKSSTPGDVNLPDMYEGLYPSGYDIRKSFEDLGGSRDDKSFIAVVHIDGNGMGNRVNDFYKSCYDEKADPEAGWQSFKKKVREFSESIDRDFKTSIKEMMADIDNINMQASLDKLDLKSGYFPVRGIIASGDDICFVCDGRIGIECAAKVIEHLTQKTNSSDKKGYSACAGVAIVHQKYPFYKAYELAEELCSSAKRFGASLSKDDNGACVSSIDWHIEQGEVSGSLEDIRKDYIAADDTRMELRPYIVSAPADIEKKEENRLYRKFKAVMKEITDAKQDNLRSRLKNIRTSLKAGQKETDYYITFHKLDDMISRIYNGVYSELDITKIGTGERSNRSPYVETSDKNKRSVLFDAAEAIDLYIPVDTEEENK